MGDPIDAIEQAARVDVALAALAAARAAAPEQLLFTKRVHSMLSQMLRRDRRGRRGLRELAGFVGVG